MHKNSKNFSLYDYAEDDIIMLLDDRKLHRSFWPSDVNIFKKINWLVEDAGEHDRLMFYYSGHGGQTCHRYGEVDGRDEVIYGYNGRTIADDALKRQLVDPVLEAKGCHLFALFDCSHSETILDLKHDSCWPSPLTSFTSSQTSGTDATRIPVPNKWSWLSKYYHIALPASIIRQSKNVMSISPWSIIETPVYNRIARMLKGSFKSTSSPIHEPVQTVSVKQPLSVNTAVASQSNWLVSPTRVVMSPISIYSNARCDGTCVMSEEENQGRVVCLSACRNSEVAHDDNETGGTLTKFFITSVQKNSSISYRGLLSDIQSHVTDLHAKRKGQLFSSFLGPKRRSEVISESDYYSTFTQIPRDWNEKVSI
ncbi:hypothetical protein M405DRAFT_823527 [Rhizopogon salebrosus TDB-379]|nr:hypothetical protein M405DRAFT_823527 [Rhizopogon salebrosus TDB-379]